MRPLSICACVKDEAPYLPEWVAFHRVVGVTRFVLYDDGSTDGTAEIAERLGCCVIRHGQWDAMTFDGLPSNQNWHKSSQCHAFEHYAILYRNHYDGEFWTAFIDPDEFLFHTAIDDLPTALEPFEKRVGLVANWFIFGGNGHKTRPDGLAIEAYTRRAEFGQPEPWGRHVKPIVNMEYRHRWGPHGSHCPVFSDGSSPVRQDDRPNPWSMTPSAPDGSGFRVHHYYHRSEEEAAAKLNRQYSMFPGYPGIDRLKAHDRNDIEDTAILRFAAATKEAMK